MYFLRTQKVKQSFVPNHTKPISLCFWKHLLLLAFFKHFFKVDLLMMFASRSKINRSSLLNCQPKGLTNINNTNQTKNTRNPTTNFQKPTTEPNQIYKIYQKSIAWAKNRALTGREKQKCQNPL